MSSKQHMVVTPTKSMGVSIFLTILFGPLGMFYSTIAGGFIMVAVALIAGLLTLGTALFFVWPCAIIWGAVEVNSYNEKQKLMKRLDCKERLYSILYG